MRSEAEIREALAESESGLMRACERNDQATGESLVAVVDTLNWVMGKDSILAATLRDIKSKRRAQRQ